MTTKHLVPFLIICLVMGLCGFATTSMTAQNSTNYYVVQYYKVLPAQESDYLSLELSVWKKIHQARVEASVLDGWYLYRVVSPNGSNTEYNYLTVNVYSNAEKLAGHFENFGIDYTLVLDAEEISMALQTPELRDQVYEEVWTAVDEQMTPTEDNMWRFQVFNAMKMRPGVDDGEYQMMEQTYWKPMHERRMDNGVMRGWGLHTMIIPGGTERDYHWATVDYYDKFIHIMGNTDGLMEDIHGQKKAEEYIAETISKRDLLKAEIREVIDYILPGTN